MYKCFLVVCLLLVPAFTAMAQKPDTVLTKSKADSASLKRDSIASKPFVPKVKKEKTYHPDSLHSPHKAVIHSLIIPGWGQFYNRRWWKIPVIYVGLGLLADGIIYNQHYYSIYIKEAQLRERGITVGRNPDLTAFQDADIVNAADGSRRYRDICILGFLGSWGIQMIDAYIDAKFIHSYTMDNNLSFKVSPGILNQPTYAAVNNFSVIPALKITFTLK